MKRATLVLSGAVVLAILAGGCYTKLYRPGMELAARGPYDSLYNRYDSTAIDTTLTEPEYDDQVYPQYDNSWYNWGRPRTRWGFDFYNYDPAYYWSYYGYYDYYSVPWWNYPYYDPWWYRPGGPGIPGEPERPRDRGRRDAPPLGGGSYVPPAPSTPMTQPPSQPDPKDQKEKKKDDDGKRGGRRGR